MKRTANAATTSLDKVSITISLPREIYQDLCAQAGCAGVSANTRAARIIEAHHRALYAESRRDPRDYRLDA